MNEIDSAPSPFAFADAGLSRGWPGLAGPGNNVQEAIERLRRRLGADDPFHIMTYRGMVDSSACHLGGRVLERPMYGGPGKDDGWLENLLNTYRRFDSNPLAGVEVRVDFRGHTATTRTDADGYYNFQLPTGDAAGDALWEAAEVTRVDGGPGYPQPVLCVPRNARFGVISDIDDTVLQSSITHWQTAARLAFLHNARTRKPLEGVSQLYHALHRGLASEAPNPIFYVSASPWNLYDLLEDFFDLNQIPHGPILLRDMDLDRASFHADTGARSKLEHVHSLIERYPSLNWILIGDSGQIDADLYAQTVRKYPGRIIAVYIRDVDPSADSDYDKFVDDHIQRITGTGVPMLRVTNSNAIAEHARSLGLIAAAQIAEVARDVVLDKQLPKIDAAVMSPLDTPAIGKP